MAACVRPCRLKHSAMAVEPAMAEPGVSPAWSDGVCKQAALLALYCLLALQSVMNVAPAGFQVPRSQRALDAADSGATK